jgi:hypothetical protein
VGTPQKGMEIIKIVRAGVEGIHSPLGENTEFQRHASFNLTGYTVLCSVLARLGTDAKYSYYRHGIVHSHPFPREVRICERELRFASR